MKMNFMSGTFATIIVDEINQKILNLPLEKEDKLAVLNFILKVIESLIENIQCQSIGE